MMIALSALAAASASIGLASGEAGEPRATIVDQPASGLEAPAGAASGPAGTWRREWPLTGRAHHSLVYDSRVHRLLLYGGGAHYDAEVWALDLRDPSSWSVLEIQGAAPDPAYGHVAVFDSVHNRMLVFGGKRLGYLTADLYALHLSGQPRWERLTPAGTGPGPRSYMSAAMDVARNRLVCFGGLAPEIPWGRNATDVWALDLLATPRWTLIRSDDEVLGGRSAAACIVDPVGDRLVLHGGWAGALAADTTVWSLPLGHPGGWERLQPLGQPPGRREHRGVWIPGSPASSPRIVYVGGTDSKGLVADDVALSLSEPPRWVDLPRGPGGPTDRGSLAACFVAGEGALYAHGGLGRVAAFNDTWLWRPNEAAGDWTLLHDPDDARPTARYHHAALYDPNRRAMFVTGGTNGIRGGHCSDWDPGGAYYRDLWSTPGNDRVLWSSLSPGGVPAHAAGALVFLDTRRNQFVWFGGYYSTPICVSGHIQHEFTFSAGLWTLDTPGVSRWVPLPTASPGPSPRRFAVGGHDPKRDRYVVWSGPPVSDLWVFSRETGRWAQIDEGPTKPAAEVIAGLVDTLHDRLLVVTAAYGYRYKLTAWSFPLDGSGTWTELPAVTEVAPGRSGVGLEATLDPTRDRLLAVVSGDEGTQVFELALSDPSAWRRLEPTGTSPPFKRWGSLIYDESRDRLTRFGGVSELADLWHLEFGAPIVRVALDVRPGSSDDRVNPRSEGVLPVAIIASADFDPSGLELGSVQLSGASIRQHGNGGGAVVLRDVNGDGLADLVAKFESSELKITAGTTTLDLTARDALGRRIRGTVPVRLGPALASEDRRATPHSRPDDPAIPADAVLRSAGEGGEAKAHLRLALPAASSVTLELFDPLGRRIASRTLSLVAGWHELSVPGGAGLSNGLYFVRATIADRALTTRILVLR